MTPETFVLIIVLVARNGTTVTAEFQTWEACEAARKHIVTTAMQGTYVAAIPAQGCFSTVKGKQ
mgnify:CR=1 FL=1